MLRINKKNCLKKLDFVPFFTIFADVIALSDVLFVCFALYFVKLKTVSTQANVIFDQRLNWEFDLTMELCWWMLKERMVDKNIV